MKYLGGMRGTGHLLCGDGPIARTAYELDGYVSNTGDVTGSGELHLPAAALEGAFGRPDLQLQTEDGRLFKLRFSGKRPDPGDEWAHVDIMGVLPGEAGWRKGGAATDGA